MNNFYNKAQLDAHIETCDGNLSHVEMPKMPAYYEFKDHSKMLPLPYCMYIDIEAILEKQATTKSNTTKLEKHIPAAIGALLIPSSDLKSTPIDEAYQYKSFVGPDSIRDFRKYVLDVSDKIYKWTEDHTH